MRLQALVLGKHTPVPEHILHIAAAAIPDMSCDPYRMRGDYNICRHMGDNYLRHDDRDRDHDHAHKLGRHRDRARARYLAPARQS